MHYTELAHNKLAIWGAGKEGLANYRFLRQRFPEIELSLLDSHAPSLQQASFQNDERLHKIQFTETDSLSNWDVVIKSPGISLHQPIVSTAQSNGTLVTSGTNLWRAVQPHAKVIAITGTKGKSTTASLLAACLESAGLSCQLAGNIGQPLLALADEKADYWILELSSYQIADLNWRPQKALLLNLFPEHLDWHGSLEQYYSDKLRLFDQAEHTQRFWNKLQPPPESIDIKPCDRWFNDPAGLHVDEHFFLKHQPIFPAETLNLVGQHNKQNACAALAIAHELQLPLANLDHCLRQFNGLPHRLQFFGQFNNRYCYDDSIATTPYASAEAIHSIEAAHPGSNVFTLIGGYDRGIDWQDFTRQFVHHTHWHLVALPDSGHEVAHQLRMNHPESAHRCLLAEDLEHAIQLAFESSHERDCIVLSPGAPSYGFFKDFQERGLTFQTLIRANHTESGL